jgi:Helix-turn-helix domain
LEISVSYPGQQATDPRNTVTMREPGTPWPIRFHFLRLGDDETDEVELLNIGFDIGEVLTLPAGEVKTQLETVPEAVDAVALQRIANNYGTYLEIARQALVLDRVGVTGALQRLRGAGRKPARLTDDFYRLIAADYEAHRQAGGHPGRELAAKHHADPGTVSRWIKAARERGFLEDKPERKDKK